MDGLTLALPRDGPRGAHRVQAPLAVRRGCTGQVPLGEALYVRVGEGSSPAIARGQDRAQLHRVDRDGPPYRPRGGLAGAAVRTGLRRDIALGREGGKPTRPGRVLLRREGLLAQLPVRGRTGTRRGGQRLLEGHGPHVRCEQEEGGGVRQGGPAEEAARGMEHGAIPVACGTGRYGGHARRRVRRCGSKDTTRVDVGSRRDEGAHRRGDQPRARKPRRGNSRRDDAAPE
mmetsp:Transcript_105/g.221  ORF Transcript_105/g.221 Transcript_105/m.221 type:complete len:230 (-) Transcript_105:654-1343(-)